MGEVVGSGRGSAQIEIGEAAVDTLEVAVAGQQLRRFGGVLVGAVRTLSGGADKGSSAGAHPFDRFGAETGFLDVYAWCEVFRHGSSPLSDHAGWVGRLHGCCHDKLSDNTAL